jgi:hypothetical protein
LKVFLSLFDFLHPILKHDYDCTTEMPTSAGTSANASTNASASVGTSASTKQAQQNYLSNPL